MPTLLITDWDITGPATLLVALTAAFIVVSVVAVVRSQRRRPVAGREDILGLVGTVRTRLNPDGCVQVRGELWQALSKGQCLNPGTKVVVTGIEGLRLTVHTKEETDD